MIVTRLTPVFVYRTQYSHAASYYRIVWLERALFVLTCTSKPLSLENWISYLPDTQVQDIRKREERTCEWQTKPTTTSDWIQGER